MANRTLAGLLVLSFFAGLFIARELVELFITTVILMLVILAVTAYRRRILTGQDGECENYEESPVFVKEEVLEGATNTSMRTLTPEYKRKIRYEIEQMIHSTLKSLLVILKAAVPYHTAGIFRRGKTNIIYLFLVNSESGHIQLGEAVPYGAGLVGQIVKEKEGRIVHEGDIRAPSTTLQYYSEDEQVRSFLGVPIIVDNVCRGAFVVDSKETNRFDEKMRQLVLSFAQVAGYIQYYFYLQLENRIDRNKVTALSSLQRRFFKLESEQEIINMLGEILETLVKSARITVSLETGKQGQGKICFVKGAEKDYFKDYLFPFSERGLISLVFERNAVIQRKFEPGRYVPRFSVREKVNHDIRSILAVPVPLSNGEKCMGVIAMESDLENHYSQIDAENVQNLANSTGLALEKIKMLNTQTHLATIDGLTGLPNHRQFQNILDERFRRAKRQNNELAVILSDIDYFKRVNDTHGHPAGDMILKGVAQILHGLIRKDVDFTARYGGEEFACIIESGETMAVETAERVRTHIAKTPFDIGGGKQIQVTMSFGVAVYPIDASKKQLLVERADKALYEAKKGGRNQVRKY
jgi:diguanylate cyclase (GGDEF)-like protein